MKRLRLPGNYVKMFGKWSGLGLLIGGLGGLLGAGFHHALHFVTALRASQSLRFSKITTAGSRK